MRDKTQEKINKKIARKKDSFRLRKADRINTSAFEGLTLSQVEERKKDNLVNKKISDKTKSLTMIFVGNIFNFCNSLIIVLCIILIALGYWDYTISSCMIIVNMAIGIYQEIKAKLTVQKLSLVKKENCLVIRESQQCEISSEEIVLDDVFVLSAGQQIPVDGLVLDGAIEVDESILTGESEGVKKENQDKVLAGSIVLAGEACVRAERVGKDCYIESISSIAKKISKPESKLFDSIDKIIKVFGVVLFVLAIMLFIAYRVAQKSWDDTLLMTISSMLGMVPCGMFLVTSTALAQSVLKLAKQHALPQDIYSVEMLAMVDTLLLDKTGTITDGNLEVVDVCLFNNTTMENIKDIIITMDEFNKDKKPTAAALNKYCEGGNSLDCVECLPFSSVRKYSAITLSNQKTYILGAPDFIIKDDPIITQEYKQFAIEGKRTILLAEFDGDIDSIDPYNTKALCLFVMQEQLKSDVKEILEWFRKNDVDIKIISGDNPETVAAIAKKAGVYNAEKYVNCAELSDEELKELCQDVTIFGRVSPEQKLLIVEELKKKKHIVGMIGDGVNDVKALKASNCSISFGNANEVARNISRIVLLDNNFKSMPNIVQEGRRVISNIEKVSSLFVMKNIFVMVITFIFAIVLMATKEIGYPFSSKQMLMLEFFVIGIPPFIFALLPNPERPKNAFMRNVTRVSIPSAVSIIVSSCLVFMLTLFGVMSDNSYDYAVSMAALAMTFAGFVSAFFISMPFNKIRLLTLILSLTVALMAAYVDLYALDGVFINIELPKTTHDTILVSLSAGVAFVINLTSRMAVKKLDEKFGDQLIEKLSLAKNKTEAFMKTSSSKIKQLGKRD